MDTPTWVLIIIGAVAAVAAVVAVIVSVYGHRKANPKKLLEYKVRVTSLMAKTRATTQKLRLVNEAGKTMVDPHWIEIALRSAGRADIRASDFDGQRPISFTLGKNTKVLEVQSRAEQFGAEYEDGNPRIFFHPYTMPCNYGLFTIKVLCEGKPEVALTKPHPLADIPVRDTSAISDSENQKYSRSQLPALVPLLVSAIVLAVLAFYLGPY